MALNLFVLLILILYYLPSSSFAYAFGTLDLFLDEQCLGASVVYPSVTLLADTCLVISGALGIAVQSPPLCASGNAALIMYQDTSCANQIHTVIDYQNCYFDGPNGIPAVLFACTAVAGDDVATATSTVTAGYSTIPVAVNTHTTPSGATNEGSTPSSNGATAVSTSSASFASPNPSQPSTNSTSSGSGSGSGSGLPQSTQIALGVALPVGGILVALFAWWFPCGRRYGLYFYGSRRSLHYLFHEVTPFPAYIGVTRQR